MVGGEEDGEIQLVYLLYRRQHTKMKARTCMRDAQAREKYHGRLLARWTNSRY